MRPLFFKNARIIDPSCNKDEQGHIFVYNKKIAHSGSDISELDCPQDTEIINCEGKIIIPGLVDLHVFASNLFGEKAGSLQKIAQAAAIGGVTSLLLQPSQACLLDTRDKFASFQSACPLSAVKIYPSAAISKNLEGHELSEYGILKEKGALMVSHGKTLLKDNAFIYKAMCYAQNFNLPFCHEPQDPALSQMGVAHNSLLANWLGLPTIIPQAETIALSRDLLLAKASGVRYHAAQISTKESSSILAMAKEQQNNISASASLAHLLFNDNDLGHYDPAFRFSPPLRPESDREAIIDALASGVIDCLTTYHEAQSFDQKNLPFEMASAGCSGLEISFAAALSLYHNGKVSLMRLIDALSTRPAQILGINAGTLQKDAPADLAIADLEEPWSYNHNGLNKEAYNPFQRLTFQGRIQASYVDGEKLFSLIKE